VEAWNVTGEYFLDHMCGLWEDIVPDIEQYYDERRANAHGILRHNDIHSPKHMGLSCDAQIYCKLLIKIAWPVREDSNLRPPGPEIFGVS
jgi:hypothetical protein